MLMYSQYFNLYKNEGGKMFNDISAISCFLLGFLKEKEEKR